MDQLVRVILSVSLALILAGQDGQAGEREAKFSKFTMRDNTIIIEKSVMSMYIFVNISVNVFQVIS